MTLFQPTPVIKVLHHVNDAEVHAAILNLFDLAIAAQ